MIGSNNIAGRDEGLGFHSTCKPKTLGLRVMDGVAGHMRSPSGVKGERGPVAASVATISANPKAEFLDLGSTAEGDDWEVIVHDRNGFLKEG